MLFSTRLGTDTQSTWCHVRALDHCVPWKFWHPTFTINTIVGYTFDLYCVKPYKIKGIFCAINSYPAHMLPKSITELFSFRKYCHWHTNHKWKLLKLYKCTESREVSHGQTMLTILRNEFSVVIVDQRVVHSKIWWNTHKVSWNQIMLFLDPP